MSTDKRKEPNIFDNLLDDFKTGVRTLDSFKNGIKLRKGVINQSPDIVKNHVRNLREWLEDWENDWGFQIKARKALKSLQELVDFEEHINATEYFKRTSLGLIEDLSTEITKEDDRKKFVTESAYWIRLISEKGVEVNKLRDEIAVMQKVIEKVTEVYPNPSDRNFAKEYTLNEMKDIADKKYIELVKVKGLSENKAAKEVEGIINGQRKADTIKKWWHPEYQ
ncbi:MAG: hypothetical protein WEA58_11430 [Balneolaceae bacterium]